MRKLALPEEILMTVDKPARYIGQEVNAVIKDLDKVNIRFCMCFPDLYEVGMSHLGIQILYDMFNRREDTWCERVYSPWTDLDRIMRDKKIPLFALESQQPVKDFDFLGITLQYEMCYTNVLQILELSQIPIFASGRSDADPVVIGGGPCAYNPEPLAPFFDCFYIGEGETVYDELLDMYKKLRDEGAPRGEILKGLSTVEGIYVPSLFDVEYNSDGTIKAIRPNSGEAQGNPEDCAQGGADSAIPHKIKKQVVTDLSSTVYPSKPVVPYIQAIQDRVVLEIQRGCIRGCRFCQAGMIYRPIRERSLDFLKKHAVEMIDSTGYEEISLSSLSSSDYSHLKELVYYLIEWMQERRVNINLPSLRIDAFALDVMGKVQDVKKSSLTFAPEAGTQHLRDIINKGLTEEDILGGAMDAFRSGWNKVKLYFMLGLPWENDEDVEGIAVLSDKIAREYYSIPKEERNGKAAITVSTSFFIPKPFSPFQWAPMVTREEYLRRRGLLSGALLQQLNRKSIKYNWHDGDTSFLEGLLARGDRRVADVVYRAYREGCIFDSWSECFDNEKWQRALEASGIDIAFYTTRERARDELMPWDFIDAGVSREFLWREYENSKAGRVTKNCREGCSGCGASSWSCGVCIEPRSKEAVCL